MSPSSTSPSSGHPAPPVSAGAPVGPGPAAGEVDRLILRVAHHLRHLGVALPDRRLRDVAEQVVLDTARFVLEWAEPDAAHAAASGEGDAEREAVSAAGVAPRGYAA